MRERDGERSVCVSGPDEGGGALGAPKRVNYKNHPTPKNKQALNMGFGNKNQMSHIPKHRLQVYNIMFISLPPPLPCVDAVVPGPKMNDNLMIQIFLDTQTDSEAR